MGGNQVVGVLFLVLLSKSRYGMVAAAPWNSPTTLIRNKLPSYVSPVILPKKTCRRRSPRHVPIKYVRILVFGNNLSDVVTNNHKVEAGHYVSVAISLRGEHGFAIGCHDTYDAVAGTGDFNDATIN